MIIDSIDVLKNYADIALHDQNYQRFIQTHNVIENTLPFDLVCNFPNYSWETRAALVAVHLAEKLKENPAFELWGRAIHPGTWLSDLIQVMVSSRGHVFLLDEGKAPNINYGEDTFLKFMLKNEELFIHRLVAYLYVPREKELADYTYTHLRVAHKNGILHDNSARNLAWELPSKKLVKRFEEGRDEGGTVGRFRPMLVIEDDKENPVQFILMNASEVKAHGMDPDQLNFVGRKHWMVKGFRFKFLGLGELELYPEYPPEGYDMSRLAQAVSKSIDIANWRAEQIKKRDEGDF